MKKTIILKLIILSLVLIGCSQDNNLGEFVKTTSPIKVPQELIDSGKFSYGFMKVPEFHSKPNGKTIELAIAIFKTKSDSATHEPLVLNTGGPGLSNIDGFIPEVSGDLGNLFLNNRDIVIIELRGLKYSKPNLFTPEIDNLQMYLVDKNLSVEETIDLYMDTLKVVYKRFLQQGVNLSAYNNYEIANDIVFVMKQLGYDKFSIFGSSFGTLVAQYLLLNHSEHLVSAVMNATVNINRGLYNMHTNSIKMLDTIFEKCKNDEKYAEAFPDLKNRFITLLDNLNEQPDTIRVTYPGDGNTYNVVLNGNKVAVWLFGEMYWNTQIPLTLHKLLSGDYSEIQERPGLIFPLHEFSNGLSLSIFLSEFPDIKDEDIPLDNEYSGFVRGCGTMIFTPYFLKRAQKVWPVNNMSIADKSIVSDVPTLMLNGAMDHVISPSYVIELSKTLKNAYPYIFPGVAHSPIDVGACGIMMMKEFIDNPSKAPNSSCMDQFQSKFVIPD
jgi:pimeloyl-ACP methyl ester carboxylesterase